MNVLVIDEFTPLVYIFVSTVGRSFQVFLQKVLNEDEFHDTFDAVFVKGLIQLIVAGTLVFYDDERIAFRKPVLGEAPGTTAVVILRAIFHFFTLVFTFLALDTLPYGDAAIFILCGPVFAGALALLFLDEPWFLAEMGSLAVCLLGAVLVIKPPMVFNSFHGDNGGEHHQPHFHFYGLLYGTLAAAFNGLGLLTLRMLGTCNKLNWKSVCVVQAAVQVALAVPSVFLAGETFNLSLTAGEYFVLLASGLVATLAQFSLTIGLQGVKVAVGSTILISQVVVGLVLQAVFIRDYADSIAVMGALMVCAGFTLLMAYKKSDNDVLLFNTQRSLEVSTSSFNQFNLSKSNGFSRSILLSRILGNGTERGAGKQTYSPVPLFDREDSEEETDRVGGGSPGLKGQTFRLHGAAAAATTSVVGGPSRGREMHSPIHGIMMTADDGISTPLVESRISPKSSAQ
jgi:drug/metabolite transporter (DMT)-like permease